MRKLGAVALAVFVVAAGFFATVWVEVRRPADPDADGRRFTVERGEPFVRVARRLEREGIIRHSRMLESYAAVMRRDRRIHAGTYWISAAQAPVAILTRLVSGDVLKVNVTIPEGYTMWEIAGAMTAAGLDSVEVLAAIADPDRIARRRIPAPTLEGYLFPDTYQVPWGADAGSVVDAMLERLDEVFGDSLAVLAARRGMSPHEVLTLASIVEAEARVPSERAAIAAVYTNRLRRHMRLEADPTVAYAMGGYRGRLLYADLQIDSPYNTYRNPGLPPGPICSPGRASILAALHPDPNTDALYFVARGDGTHIFSRTLREHKAAVKKVRRLRRAQRRNR